MPCGFGAIVFLLQEGEGVGVGVGSGVGVGAAVVASVVSTGFVGKVSERGFTLHEQRIPRHRITDKTRLERFITHLLMTRMLTAACIKIITCSRSFYRYVSALFYDILSFGREHEIHRLIDVRVFLAFAVDRIDSACEGIRSVCYGLCHRFNAVDL